MFTLANNHFSENFLLYYVLTCLSAGKLNYNIQVCLTI